LYASDKRIDEAEQVLINLINKLPEADGPKLALVDFLISQRSKEIAETKLLALIKENPKNFSLRFALLRIYQDQPDRIKEVLNSIVADDPAGKHGLDAQTRLAAIAISEKDMEKARGILEEVIKADQKNSNALLMRAGLFLNEKNFDAATADLRTVLRDEPESEKALLLLASTHLQNGKIDLARESLEKILAINPKNLIASRDLARLMVRQNQADAALALLEKTQANSDKDVETVVMLVDLYGQRKDWPKAEAAAQSLLDLSENKELAHYKMAQVNLAQGKAKEATDEFKKVLEIKPFAIDAVSGLVNSYLAQKDIKQAEKTLDDILAKQPENGAFLSMRGEIYLKQNKFAEGEKLYSKVV
ncbi:MAG: tetratricopeptide repeat protein, partial [Methylicorpusculum sp.]|nr:tetratricopeptide repeat protein [Methylicorpusculum sp.]